MQMRKRPLWAVLTFAALAGCGGGESEPRHEPATSALLALGSAAAPAAHASAGPQRRAQAYSANLADKLFAFAESSHAELFPNHQATQSFDGWSYRYYPETGIYLAVIGDGVYGLGGVFGTHVQSLGPITQFVEAPATGKDRPLTASILAQCPEASASSSPEFYKCMVGYLNGVQKFDSSKSCRLEISETGVVTLSSQGSSVAVAPAFAFSFYSKTGSAGLIAFTIKAQDTSAYAKKIEVSAAAFALSFSSGGTLSAEATPSGSNTASISCTLTVPK